MEKQHKHERPPWRPRIEQLPEFHTGVPPRDLIGEVPEPPLTFHDTEAEELDPLERTDGHR